VPLAAINSGLGLQLSAQEVAALLTRMGLSGSAPPVGEAGAAPSVSVLVPPTRSDVLHACDVVEDVAIAYGYNNLTKHVR
jgi:phenylalanyl-tRNA synthetase beta chain